MINQYPEQATMVPPGNGATLQTILGGVDYSIIQSGKKGDRGEISTVTCDSRSVGKDSLFIALSGTVTDGHQYVADAAAKGCVAIVVEKGATWELPEDVTCTVIEVADSKHTYGRAAANYFGCPGDKLKVIGVTGTNGKTTISYLVEDVLRDLGYNVGVIGTVNYRYSVNEHSVVLPSPFTTPEAIQLQELLFKMANVGVNIVIMEVSSHALEQQRIGDLQYDVVAFTNLSQDHLDYHHTMEEYFEAKKLLFSHHVKEGGKAVISRPQQPGEDVDWSGKISEYCRNFVEEVLLCGKEDDASVRISDYSSTLHQTELQLEIGGETVNVSTPLVGHFNVDNLTTALTIVMAIGEKTENIVSPLSRSIGAPGRLERIVGESTAESKMPAVFVDYAHTPDALKQVLATLKAIPHRELFCVFGCGGDRDEGKRPLMGGFAAQYADVAVVTDDNPRSEDPESIRSQIIPGVEKGGLSKHDTQWLSERDSGERGFVEIGIREAAIRGTIRAAGPGDIVLIAGKGHEKYQLNLRGKRFFDDCLEAQTALMSWTQDAVIQATGGSGVIENDGKTFLGEVSSDSRTIGSGDIFVALKGERFDAHDFLDSVKDSRAGCLVINQDQADKAPAGISRVEVPDTLEALGKLARYRRRVMTRVQDQVVIGITGSCGKTTVKEMTGAILRRRWPAGPDYPEDSVLQTKGNLNNLIGLPLSLLPLTPRHRAAVLEMGMNAPGEIQAMARVAEPDICCITNVYGVHLEGLGNIEGVAAAKGELFAEAPANSTLVVNLDDPHVSNIASAFIQKKITFSVSADNPGTEANLYSSDIIAEADGVITFMLHYAGQEEQIHLYTVGLHNVSNALAAAAIAVAAGASLAEIAAGLADFRPADRRMVQVETTFGVGLLNDTYNANPASMEAGISTLVHMGSSSTAAILGDMLELGESAKKAHFELGGRVAGLGVNYLGVVGEFKNELAQGAVENGMDPDNVLTFDDKEEAAKWVEHLQQVGKLVKGDWVLVKASRGLKMETIVARLVGKP